MKTTKSNRAVVITGASGGMGREAAARYLELGDRVALLDVDAATLASVAGELRAQFPSADVLEVTCNVASPESVEAARDTVAAWSGEVDVLALIAGVLQKAGPITELSIDEWDRTQNINLRGVFLMARTFIPLMPSNDGASIVTIGSWYGRSGHALFSAYCASKAGVINLTQTIAAELAEKGIRANVVCPGNIDTQMHRKALHEEAESRGITFEEMKAIEWAKIPLGIAGPASTIVDAVEFLTSAHASYITGASIDVNGGVLFH
ncbi:SDR family NAD(P)-dependent oxidoreductase [Herbiconiux daphne]|uniref:SDR family oxidoreductase n=1 Tax=Herbiconiux daphne TaxID=2970914 RepID=A0ABT2H5K0_9MICO|nr:SDR family NAD(P)-dependent oxidoreductase [Herbiconiux daphne]MCS5735184.1 SDR family oxidoreductase [Herbiconiux daphne]